MKVNLSRLEETILKYWRQNNIFQKSIKQRREAPSFVFYEGPPTANGEPGIHHVLSRAFKDLIPRYKTMQGYQVERKAGWDTHGLPVELEVEKDLKLKQKQDIEKYGIKKFNEKCKVSVWKYKEEWEKMTERIGFWIDLKNPYITYDNDYIETLWWIIKQVYEKGLLYKGHKVVPQCPRCGTALSSHEVALGYKNIEEESLYIKFKIKGKENEYLLAWTTTPWTLPGNVALAVAGDVEYILVEDKDSNEKYILAQEAAPHVLKYYPEERSGFRFTEKIKGKDLVGLEYEPLFPGVVKKGDKNIKNAFKIYPADFVSTEEGTGIVHTAVMYGQEDYELGEKVGLPKVHSVNLDGTFNERIPKWQGRFVKDVDDEITEDLKKRNLLFKTEKYAHDYPFCWRCDSPLLYYAKDSWFFKMSDLKDKLIENNSRINWIPSHVKEGRFGEWLRDIKDWAISRERYWGTPIPIWICEKCEKIKVIGSRKDLGLKKDFDLHRPYIDKLKIKCDCGSEMKRIPEIMDCWFDSGAMPFAQYHYPFENKDLIDKGKQYPADFIAEGMDQTRGWFYTLLAISTLLNKGPCYRNVISHGLVLDKKGKKMSKSLGNVVNIWKVINKYGSDVIRWYFYTINQPGEPKRFDEHGLKESSRIFITLLNVVNFYKMFASEKVNDLQEKDLTDVLDKWINSKLNLLIQDATERLDRYDITAVARKIEEFINDLSVWYVRRSRSRFKNEDKKAIRSLRRVIFNLIRLMAPFVPFITEYIYQEMEGRKESVHLEDWPDARDKFIDKKLEQEMERVREICSTVLQKRVEAGIRVRQPLNKLSIPKYKLENELLDLIKDEVNVKKVVFDSKLKEGVKLDTKITPELEEQGMVREFIRQIQAERKKQGLTPKDKIKVYFPDLPRLGKAGKELKEIVEKNKNQIKKQVIAEDIVFSKEFKIEKI